MRMIIPVLAFAATAQIAIGQGALTYPGCNITYSDNAWTQESLVKRNAGSGQGGVVDATLSEPVKAAVGTDPEGNIEVFIVELRGGFKVYRAKTKTVHLLKKLDVAGGPGTPNPEEGLMGVVLDPKFATNRWLYLYYSVKGPLLYRVSRFTLSADRSTIGEEQTIYEFAVQRNDCCHTGGGMAFDDLGDLWLTIGNNEGRGTDGISETNKIQSGEWGSSSTASVRGGIIRIHPLSKAGTDGKWYAVPKGNFGEYWAAQFEQQGKAALAAQYRDPAKVLPEIYVKGNRNPYGIALDKVRRWAATGDVGPDGDKPDGTPKSQGEDHDLYLKPAFAGWPYFAGKDRHNAGNKDPNKPMNNSKWNTGVNELPPSHDPLWEENNGASFGAAFYRFDKNNPSTTKLPAIFHKHMIWGNWSGGGIYVAKIDEQGRMVGTTKTQVFGNKRRNGPTDVVVGPDGAIYVVNYAGFFGPDSNTRVDRYYYTGQQCNVDIPIEKAGCKARDPSVTLDVPEACFYPYTDVAVGVKGFERRGTETWRKMSATLGGIHGLLEIPEGIRHVEVYDLGGRKALTWRNDAGARSMRLPAGFPQGLYQVMMSK
jgi:cytochrome c